MSSGKNKISEHCVIHLCSFFPLYRQHDTDIFTRNDINYSKSMYWSIVISLLIISCSRVQAIKCDLQSSSPVRYITIIPRARRMRSESIAHEVEGRIGYWLRVHEGEWNNCFSKIQLVGQKNIEANHRSLVIAIVLVFKSGAFRY